MATAFHSVEPPQNFGVILYDNEDYITLKVDTDEILALSDSERTAAVEYINKAKRALEDNGAIVLVVREAIEE